MQKTHMLHNSFWKDSCALLIFEGLCHFWLKNLLFKTKDLKVQINILTWIFWHEYSDMNILTWIFWHEYSDMKNETVGTT